MPEKIELGKSYCTREGKPAVILAVGLNNPYYSVAAVHTNLKGKDTVAMYDEYGRIPNSPGPSKADLVEVTREDLQG